MSVADPDLHIRRDEVKKGKSTVKNWKKFSAFLSLTFFEQKEGKDPSP